MPPIYYMNKYLILKGLVLQAPLFKNHTQIIFYTQMFISQINFPFKHKEWNLNLHKDESKMKSLQYIVITWFFLGHYWL